MLSFLKYPQNSLIIKTQELYYICNINTLFNYLCLDLSIGFDFLDELSFFLISGFSISRFLSFSIICLQSHTFPVAALVSSQASDPFPITSWRGRGQKPIRDKTGRAAGAFVLSFQLIRSCLHKI